MTILLVVATLAFFAPNTFAQKPPYFVTYSQVLEEPGNLEIAQKGLGADPKHANGFYSSTFEFEYGATAWWTTEVYLQGQTTANDSTVFTGYRWENRFRPLASQHVLNPVFYIEFEDVNGVDKSLMEITGNDSIAELQVRNAVGQKLVERSIENKLILSSTARGWDISENFIAEKDLSSHPLEFGYAIGTSRPLALEARGKPCVLCRENVAAGVELYGGLGTTDSFGLSHTSQYAGPTVSLNFPRGPTLAFSHQFGLNHNSVGAIWRVKASYEVQQFRDLFRRKDKQ